MTDEQGNIGSERDVPAWLAAAGFASQPSDQSWDSLALDPAALTPLAEMIERVAELLDASDPWGGVTDELPRLTPQQRDAFGR